MSEFSAARDALLAALGTHRTMVLSTSLGDHVTSRMMSVVILDGRFYFQTDASFRKYEQLMANPNAALCAENFQIEGTCGELGSPLDHPAFCELYRAHFRASFDRYTHLSGERLFALEPIFAKSGSTRAASPSWKRGISSGRNTKKRPTSAGRPPSV